MHNVSFLLPKYFLQFYNLVIDIAHLFVLMMCRVERLSLEKIFSISYKYPTLITLAWHFQHHSLAINYSITLTFILVAILTSVKTIDINDNLLTSMTIFIQQLLV